MLNSVALLLKSSSAYFLGIFQSQSKSKAYPASTPRWFPQAVKLADIDLDLLQQARIRGIILDLDNTLVSEDDRYVSPGAEEWIHQAKQRGFRLFFLSNGKRVYRVKYWSYYLDIPGIHRARKPFPQSFRKAMVQMQVRSREVVVIGDSRHTDMMGALLSGCRSIQVHSLPHPPRWWEKLAGRWVQIAYAATDELLLFDISRYS